jgi:hypothetical protein
MHPIARTGALLAATTALLWTGCRPQPSSAAPDPQLVAAINEGVSLMGQYHYDAAVNAFERALDLSPQLIDAKVNLAISLFNRARKEDRDTERGTALLTEVLAQEPDHIRARYFQGIIRQHLGNAEEAILDFARVVELQPEDGIAWYLLGLCKLRIGQPAEPDLLKAVSLRPYLFSAHYQLYQLAQRRADTTAAQHHLEQFKSLRDSPLGESIELPQYGYMGDLAMARPMGARPAPPATAQYRPTPPTPPLHLPPNTRWTTLTPPQPSPAPPPLGGAALGDLDRDGVLDLIATIDTPDAKGTLRLLRGIPNGGWQDVTANSGLVSARGIQHLALGDFDNDGILDLFATGPQSAHLFKGHGNATFQDVTLPAGLTDARTHANTFALFLDADHDADLDLLIGNDQGCQLWRNNADGTFTPLGDASGLPTTGPACVMALPADLDGDRDMDLVLLFDNGPARVFFNQLLGRFEEAPQPHPSLRGDRGGILQDLNADGIPDLLVASRQSPVLQLAVGDGKGRFQPLPSFDNIARTAESWGPIRGIRAFDADLDGDLDVAVLTSNGHLLLNAGNGSWIWQAEIWPSTLVENLTGAEWLDLTGDFIPDLLGLEAHPALAQLTLVPGSLSIPMTALTVAPTGTRSRDGRTRSPACGFGTRMTVRAGLREQSLLYTGSSGGPHQSAAPPVFGLAGAPKADYLQLHWPDGVSQFEIALPAGKTHTIAELQRKVSSCPVLFAWNGQRFEFITDFAGVGGLGYYVAPNETAPPQVLEHVKIEPHQLVPHLGYYELRITEPMEEVAYIDRLELLAIDHPAGSSVFPDERLALSGPPPTHELIFVTEPLFPLSARSPLQQDCTPEILQNDRVYAYTPPLDRRFIGFCEPHSLELDFGRIATRLDPHRRTFLFIRGTIEYPYSQTVYAAGQTDLAWQPIRVDHKDPLGQWITLIPDAGAPGGMDRTMTIELTGLLNNFDGHLRLTTNLEIYYDQIYLAQHSDPAAIQTFSLPVNHAELRHSGFALEYSPDGRLPLLYDYELSQPTAPFHTPRGAYTRYGNVTPLLHEFDDQFVLVGPGDEIAVRFDATTLPPPPPGHHRSFILVSHAYCKDMDLYTATPQTVEPLPFRAMSRYPYGPDEQYPDAPENRRYQLEFNTRLVE